MCFRNRFLSVISITGIGNEFYSMPDSPLKKTASFLLQLFPWARNFTPIASATQLLNRNVVYNMYQGMAEEQPTWLMPSSL